jgi:hypothetical protein
MDRTELPGLDGDGFIDVERLRPLAIKGTLASDYAAPALIVEGDLNRARTAFQAAADRERSFKRTSHGKATAAPGAPVPAATEEDAGDVEVVDVSRYAGRAAFLVKRPGGLFPGMITLGRALNNDIAFMVGSVSKVHGYFRQEGDRWSYTDQRSTNGTLHNQRRLDAGEKVVLRDGDRLQFGEELACLFVRPESLAERLLA